jgi:amino acid adenylation domain-containing protein
MSEFSNAPLSLEQERMWLLARLHGALPAFHERGAVWVDGEIDVPRLTRAIQSVAARQEVLRTDFIEDSGRPTQLISSATEIAFREVKLNADASRDADMDALAIAREEVSIPFDLESRPLFRVSLIAVHPTRSLLVLTMHHIISDGDYSVRLFFDELFSAYHGADLPPLEAQYQSYARWQLAQISADQNEAQLSYWYRELAGAPAALALPTDRPRPAAQTFAGEAAEHSLDAAVLGDLKALAQANRTDLFTLLLATLQALLQRYSAQDDILVGTPLPGRTDPSTHKTIGYFGNPVVIRGRFADDPPFQDLLRQIHRAVEGARAHGDVSFRAIVERLAPPRDPSRTPLFQVLFDVRAPAPGVSNGPLLTFRPTDVELPYVSYDLIVSVREHGDGAALRIEYNRDLFDSTTIGRLTRQWEALIRSVLTDPKERVSRLPILSEAERHQILVEWNKSAAPAPPEETVHALFEAQALKRPSALALLFGQERVTYAQLDRSSNQVAHLLRRHGVGRDVLVGVCMDRSVELIVAMLGILKAGGAYVPFDPTNPPERLAFMLEDSGVQTVLTKERFAASIPGGGVNIIRFDADQELFSREPESKPEPSGGEGPDSLAYVMYTSGSTGRPKGVAIEHRCILSLLTNTDYVQLGPDERVAQAANASFDAATFEIWGALLHGGQLIGLTRDVTLSPHELARAIRKENITTMFLTSALFSQVAWEAPQAFANLRNLLYGGEVTDPECARRVIESGGPERLLHVYGPTETTTYAAWYLVHRAPAEAGAIPIGRPIAHTTIYILDRNLEPVPIGVTGEIYIGGEGVARGYFRRPELTRERFLTDPFAPLPGARMYRTGDLARSRSDGNIEFLGRADHQVKIRGFRIELGEVEAALREHPAVQEAVVLTWAEGPSNKRLVAYIVPASARGNEALIPALRAFLSSKLPDYMIPSTFTQVDALPINANGKVDRAALPAPDAARPDTEREFVAPRSELEESLADVWRELLRVSRVGVHDNFFELGGHSLHAVRLFSRIRNTFGVNIKFQVFFSHPTIADLAMRIRMERTVSGTQSPITTVPRHGPLPLSFGQERLWFLFCLAPESRAYNCMFPFRLTGQVDVQALDRSLRELVKRHEILRTTYVEIAGRPVQVISLSSSFRLDVADLQHLSPEERETEARDRIDAEAQRVFDLARGPLFRAGLLRLAGGDHVLWLHFHHITMDGWSTEVAFRDVGALYDSFSHGRPPALPEIPVQYADFAVWQRKYMDSDALSSSLSFWIRRLEGAPPLLDLPSDRPRPPVQSFAGGTAHFNLAPPLIEAMKDLSVQLDMTLTMAVLASFAVLLHRYTQRDDILIGMPSASRDRTELERVMGFFVNTIPIRIDLSGDPTFESLLRRVRKACLEAYDFDMLPFERLVQELRIERTPSYNPLVQVAFAPQPPAGRDLRLRALETRILDADAKKTIFDLSFYFWENEGGAISTLEYSADLFEQPTIERMIGHFITLATAAVADPDLPISSLPLLTDAERQRTLFEWNDTATPLQFHRCAHEMFEEQVEATPDAAAVVFDDRSLTYRELNERANQLAHHLRALGVGRERIVGSFVDKSLDAIVAFFGILKAGGAYLPLDPSYPRDRIAFMLEDSSPAALLVHERLQDRLPPYHGAVIRLDADWPLIARQSDRAPTRLSALEDAAYVIYTSGSTGTPKGAVIEHRNAAHLAEAMRRSIGVTPASRVLQFASLGFDASIADILMTLTAGAALYLVSPRAALPGPELSRFLSRNRINIATLPPSVLMQQPLEPLPSLTTLIVAGEACPAELVDDWGHDRRFINAYGPTEATVCATLHACSPGRGDPPIGRAIPNVRLYILDAHRELAPVGVPGELYIGGAGVARGYLNRDELTRERFIPDPFSEDPAARLYRTGDLVRWLPDGAVEFLGRIDHQVKIRGYRVELGEIEARLREHPAVKEAVVLLRKDTPSGDQLVAYIVPSLDEKEADRATEPARDDHISAWRALYEETHGSSAGVDRSFNTTGWRSSFTGAPFPAEVMRVWRDHTVDRIKRLRPDKVLEIGCGSGLLLLKIAPQCKAYVGADFSESTLRSLEPEIRRRGLSNVSLVAREAIDFTGVKAGEFDVVIVNSVVQYFPDLEYLRAVLDGASRAVGHGGVIFLGDVRSLPLLEAFHTAVQLHQSPRDITASALRERVSRAILEEKELLLSPAYFQGLHRDLPGLTHVEVWLKRGGSDEMTRYRYDVVLFMNQRLDPVPIEGSRQWSACGGLEGVEQWLLTGRPQAIEVLRIPNSRVYADVLASEQLKSATGAVEALARGAQGDPGAVDPEALWELGEKLGYAVRVTWSRAEELGYVDALFERAGDPDRFRAWLSPTPAPAPERAPAFANDPLREKRMRRLVPSVRAFLQAKLPDYMNPGAIIRLESLPLTPNGKIDRAALPDSNKSSPEQDLSLVAPTSDLESSLVAIWLRVLHHEQIGIDDAFFEVGGHSLLLTQVQAAIRTELRLQVSIVDLFQYPTIRSLASHLRAQGAAKTSASEQPQSRRSMRPSLRPGRETRAAPSSGIAIIGTAGRFPKAGDVEAFWSNLVNGVEAISFYTPEELQALGIPEELIRSPAFVPACGVMEDAMCFDAPFFGYSPRDARLMDPQHRVFLECAWEAMERAGYNPLTYPKLAGVFGGSHAPIYWLERIGLSVGPFSAEDYQIAIGNVTDNLTTRVAHKLRLRGPAITVLTACSTSLVAVHLACQSLLARECDMALAGGVVILAPFRIGHVHEEGAITSPDGHCRPFDAASSGTVGGSGVGLVVLKRLEDALADGDTIHAVIRGSAVSNDGGAKVSYTAPAPDGQVEAIARAQAAAGVSPETITFVEAHGTGTRLGDPIEVAALTRVFQAAGAQRGHCALGSVKSNVGHLSAAAGVTGLIKAALCLEREVIPPTLHFRRPNPDLHLNDSPFFVNTKPLEWKRGAEPRRAGVSAFGLGGTNAHVVLEEAPAARPSGPSRSSQLLVLSARTEAALESATARLVAHLQSTPSANLADVAFTLQQGRAAFAHRRAAVCADVNSAVGCLTERGSAGVFTRAASPRPPEIVFMFPGGGTQRVDMGRELYAKEPAYRESIDRCAALFQRELPFDIRSLLFPGEERRGSAEEEMLHPRANLAAIFATEYALAELLLSWGIRPAALTGHSLGEYTAACVAGVLSLEDAISLVATRGQLYEELPDDSATLIVHMSEEALTNMLHDGLSLAAVNGPEACAVSGPSAAIRRFEAELKQKGCDFKRLFISVAAHSALVEPLMDRLTQRAELTARSAPRIPLISNLTGGWMTDEDAVDPSYWARHLRGTVRFADGLATLLENPRRVFIEVGPGRTLATLASRHPGAGPDRLITSTMASASSDEGDVAALLAGVGRLWCAGVEVDWAAFLQEEQRRRVPLPSYPFERVPYGLDPIRAASPPRASDTERARRAAEAPAPSRSSQPVLASDARDLPQTDVQRAVADAWQQILGIDQIGIHKNFFEIGGDSLVAIRLLHRLRQALSVSLDSHVLVETPTISTISERIEELRRQRGAPGHRAAAPEDILVKLQDGRSRSPLFLVHPIGGSVYCYTDLARGLRLDDAVYGIRSPRLGEAPGARGRVEDIAQMYINRIRGVQESGPYFIGGWSFGGVVAFEMARQLQAEGHSVSPPILIDSPAPAASGAALTVGARALAWFAADLGAIPEAAIAEETAALERLSPAPQFEHILRRYQASHPEADLVEPQQIERLFHVFMDNMLSLREYSPRPYPGSLVLLQASEALEPRLGGGVTGEEAPRGESAGDAMGWEVYAGGGVELHQVPGNHFTIMKKPSLEAVIGITRRHLLKHQGSEDTGRNHDVTQGL